MNGIKLKEKGDVGINQRDVNVDLVRLDEWRLN